MERSMGSGIRLEKAPTGGNQAPGRGYYPHGGCDGYPGARAEDRVVLVTENYQEPFLSPDVSACGTMRAERDAGPA